MGNQICIARRRGRIEERFTRPQTSIAQTLHVDYKKLRKLILSRKLAPCFDGVEESNPESDLEECPICFLLYPSLNRSRCCKKGICTECFLQMKPSNPVIPAQCPFCKTSSYAVEYNGARSQKERILERAEEQKVIEAKIRMQLQESQNTYPMTPAEQNLSSVAVLSPVSRSRQLCETRDDDPPVLRHLESGVEPEEFMLMKATRQSVQDSSLQKSTAVQLSPGFQSETSYETFIREDQNRMGSTPSRDIDMHDAGSSRYSEDTDFDWPRSETDFLARYSTTEEDSWELLSACILEGKQSSDNGLIFDEDMVSSSVDTTPDVSSASQHYSDKYEHLSSSHIPCPASNGIH